MRLVDLNPRWFALDGRNGQGVCFDCPCNTCAQRTPMKRVRLAAAFSNPLDGGAPVSLEPKILWPALWPRPDEPEGLVTVPPGVHWRREGDSFETLSLTPSVDASKSGHWHGMLTNGGVR